MTRSWRTGCPVGRGCPACGVEAKARVVAELVATAERELPAEVEAAREPLWYDEGWEDDEPAPLAEPEPLRVSLLDVAHPSRGRR